METANRALLAKLMASGEAPTLLSYGQQSLWFMDRVRPAASVAYNAPFAWTIHGTADPDALCRAFAWLTSRHAIFRTTYEQVGGIPVQRVRATMAVDFRIIDLPAGQNIVSLFDTEALRPFDLAHGPVMRAALIRPAGRSPVLLWVVHHIAIDAWSLFQLLDELGHAYTAFAHGSGPTRPRPATTYADFVAWQAEMLAGPAGARLREYWTRALRDAPPMLALPTDRSRPPDQTFTGDSHAFHFGVGRSAVIQELAARSGVTLYTAMLAAFQVTLGRAGGQADFLIGTSTSGRSRPEFADVVGYFVNPLPIRADLSDDPSFATVLSRTHTTVIDTLDHQDYPLPLLVDELGTRRDSSRSPLFDVLFTLRSSQQGEFTRSDAPEAVSPLGASSPGERGMAHRLGDLTLATFPLDQRTTRFDLDLELIAVDGEISGLLRYNTDLFDPDTVAWFAERYMGIIDAVTANPDLPISAIAWPQRPEQPRHTAGRQADNPAAGAISEANATSSKLIDTIIDIWCEVLGVRRRDVDPHAGFFAVGGHSLAAVGVAMELQARLNVTVSISEIFRHQTPAALADRIASLTPTAAPGPRPTTPGTPETGYPLSYSQQSLWISHHMASDSIAYSAPHAFRLRGRLDVGVLEWALNQVLARHESLRTTFMLTRNGPRQFVREPTPVHLTPVRASDVTAMISREYREPFDLAAGPPVRVVLYRVSAEDHVLLFLVHHIVSDGWSTEIFWRDLSGYYRARTGHGAMPTPPALRYADYAVWQHEALSGERRVRLVDHWRKRLVGMNTRRLPTDFPRPKRPRFEGAQRAVELPVDPRALCAAADATPHMVYLAAFQVWLARRIGTTDVVVGSVVSGRTRAEIADVIGYFVNVVPVRTDLAGASTFTDVVRRTRQSLLDAYEYQELPLVLLTAELGLSRETPFDAIFAMHERERETAVLPGVTVERFPVPVTTAQFDLAMDMTDLGGTARAVLEYDVALFRADTVAAMSGELGRLIADLVRDPDLPLAR